jgi:phosphoribosylformimino-5-aminoimidazole carboxamide ribotide isomerase
MKFRPCIDLHNGKVKQIVGSTLSDSTAGTLITNFETDLPPAHFAGLYRNDNLAGGHVIMLGEGNTPAALEAVQAFPGGMHVGGGINPDNAGIFLDAGASHVIVTSYVFKNGLIVWENLEKLTRAVGKQRLVLDLSCKKDNDTYYVATDRWQHLTSVSLSPENLVKLAKYCDEFLVHAVDVEGKQQGVDTELVALLAQLSPIPMTYAGGIRSLDDMDAVYSAGGSLIDATIGSALDIFGGSLPYRDAVAWHKKHLA